MTSFVLYGATGHTGALIARAALAAGYRPLLAGRDEKRLHALAMELDLDYETAELEDAARLRVLCGSASVVVNAAGPFENTSERVVEACLAAKSHYLDITGEVAAIERTRLRDEPARQRGIMLMNGVGFEVVASDCLASFVAQRLPNAALLRLAVRGVNRPTAGSGKTAIAQAGQPVLVRRNGLLEAARAERSACFPFDTECHESLPVTWADLASAYYTTGIPNIETYIEATAAVRWMLAASRAFPWLRLAPVRALMSAQTDLVFERRPPAPASECAVVVADACRSDGRCFGARLATPEVYAFTAASTVAVLRRVLCDDLEPGFQTPARVYGADFVLTLAGVTREVLEAPSGGAA